jgi:hypothetical protein
MVSPKLASREFASNPPAYSKMRHLFLKIHQPFSKSAGFSENSLVLAQKSPLGLGVGGKCLGSISCSPSPRSNSSFFALFFLIVVGLGSFIDVNCPS